MKLKIDKQTIKGTINVITSKSIAQRAIVSAFISPGSTTLKNVNLCDDCMNTINLLREITKIRLEGENVEINGFSKEIYKKYYCINESLSTFNFLFPLIAYYSKSEVEFILGDRLSQRIQNEYEDLYKYQDKYYFVKQNNIIKTNGFPISDNIKISNKRTSQCVSGILFLLASINKDTTIEIESMNSIAYIDMTIEVLNGFGYNVRRENKTIFVMHNQIAETKECEMPGDGSYYVMLQALKSVNKDIKIKESTFSNNDSDYLLGKNVELNNFMLEDEIDLSNNPDAICALSFLALNKNKPTKFINIERLSTKESNRITTTSSVLESFGIKTCFDTNSLIVYPSNGRFGEINVFNDHRIAQLAILLAMKYGGSVDGIECLSKSAPKFIEDLKQVGFTCECVEEMLIQKLENQSSTVIFKENSLNLISKFDNNQKHVVITDKNIPSNYIDEITQNLNNFVVYRINDSGESVKTIPVYNEILGFLLKNDIKKTDTIVSVGGGTISDLCGYIASTYKRGMNLIVIPTTLLSMCDAAIGFKNGINVGNIKNSVGSYCVPKAVVVDPLTLKTLNKTEIKSGLAELIKIFSLRNNKYFYEMYDSNDLTQLNKWILEAIKLKIEFVNTDPFDKRERHALNFGHTYGHAFELMFGISHGEAVAKGMRVLSHSKKLNECLDKFGFEKATDKEILDTKKLIKNDKKIENNIIKVVELLEIGKYIISDKNL